MSRTKKIVLGVIAAVVVLVIAALAAVATVSQLRTAVRLEPRPDPDPRPEPQRSITRHSDDAFSYWRIKLPHVEAAKFDAAEEAAKTELQRANDRAAAAEADALTAKREAFAATKGVPASMVTGSTPQEWETAAAAALEWKGQQAPPAPAPNSHAAGNNGAPAGSPGDIDAQIAEAEKARNFTLAIALKQRKAAAQQTT